MQGANVCPGPLITEDWLTLGGVGKRLFFFKGGD